jgi:ribosomal protein S18 acetylase RimI-like enzyme
MEANLPMLQRLEHSLKNAAAKSRTKVVHEYFDAFLSPSPEPHLSFAVPKAGLEQPKAIEALIETFYDHGRVPRLEYFHELHPNVRGALGKKNFLQDMWAPVMTLTPQDLSSATQVNAAYQPLTDDAEQMKTFLRCQSKAFGGADGDDALVWLAGMTSMMQAGELMGAFLEQQGKMVSGAVIQGATDGELAGVWTLPNYQRQGLSYALCQRLLTDYFSKGQELCWLSAAEAATKLYQKLGFAHAGVQINLRFDESLPELDQKANSQ